MFVEKKVQWKKGIYQDAEGFYYAPSGCFRCMPAPRNEQGKIVPPRALGSIQGSEISILVDKSHPWNETAHLRKDCPELRKLMAPDLPSFLEVRVRWTDEGFKDADKFYYRPGACPRCTLVYKVSSEDSGKPPLPPHMAWIREGQKLIFEHSNATNSQKVHLREDCPDLLKGEDDPFFAKGTLVWKDGAFVDEKGFFHSPDACRRCTPVYKLSLEASGQGPLPPHMTWIREGQKLIYENPHGTSRRDNAHLREDCLELKQGEGDPPLVKGTLAWKDGAFIDEKGFFHWPGACPRCTPVYSAEFKKAAPDAASRPWPWVKEDQKFVLFHSRGDTQNAHVKEDCGLLKRAMATDQAVVLVRVTWKDGSFVDEKGFFYRAGLCQECGLQEGKSR
jgi:hypothetical protein